MVNFAKNKSSKTLAATKRNRNVVNSTSSSERKKAQILSKLLADIEEVRSQINQEREEQKKLEKRINNLVAQNKRLILNKLVCSDGRDSFSVDQAQAHLLLLHGIQGL